MENDCGTDGGLNRSPSDSNINLELERHTTPPNVTAFRNKRSREDLEEEKLEIFKEEILSSFASMMQIQMKKQEDEIKKINPTLLEIKKSNENIENTISFLAAQNEDFKKRIERLESERKKDREYIVLLEDKLEDMRREGQKNNFEIKNVPKSLNSKETKEDLLNMVVCLSKSIDCPIKEEEISDIYRLKGKKQESNNSTIVVETSSTRLKTSVLQMSKQHNIKNKDKLRAKHLGFKTREDTPIYISEQLTAKGARLFFLARDLAKARSYRFCWTSYGRVYIRKTTDSSIISINSEAQVQKLMQET